jgi:hypothetical protein
MSGVAAAAVNAASGDAEIDRQRWLKRLRAEGISRS